MLAPPKEKKMLISLETKIQMKIDEIVEVYKETLLLSKVFPDDGDFKIALLREKKAIKALNLKLKGDKK